MYVRIPRSPFSVCRTICVFLQFLSAVLKGRHVQSTNSNQPSYLHPNVPDSVVLHLSDPGGTFHLVLHLRLLNSEGSNQDIRLILQPRSLNLSNMFHTSSLYRGSLMSPRNFFTSSLNVFHASSSISVIVSVKLSSIISL